MSGSEPIHPDEKSKPQFACFRASAEFIQLPHVTDGPDDYYKKNKIIDARTHTAQEAITLIGVYGHWEPWN